VGLEVSREEGKLKGNSLSRGGPDKQQIALKGKRELQKKRVEK